MNEKKNNENIIRLYGFQECLKFVYFMMCRYRVEFLNIKTERNTKRKFLLLHLGTDGDCLKKNVLYWNMMNNEILIENFRHQMDGK